MRTTSSFTPLTALVLVFLLSLGASLQAQTWEDFAHPDSPHILVYDAPLSIPPLIDDPNAVINLPVLVILLEMLPDNEHHNPNDHTPAFYHDFVFGDGTGDWSSQWPSVKQIIHGNSNGRVQIYPAPESHGTHNDGIVGWVDAECPPGTSGGLCVDGDHDNQSCDPDVPGACEAGGGHCEVCDSWEYYRFKDYRKRAEAIRRADPYVNFGGYDTKDPNWSPGPDGYVSDNELAILIIHAMPNCQDRHGHASWGTDSCMGGTVRPTDPASVPVDGETVSLLQHPSVIPEGNDAHTLAHEFSHQVFGLDDLYTGFDNCNPSLTIPDGTICYSCEMDQAACNDACPDAACLTDGAIWGGNRVARGSTQAGTGSDVSLCASNDTIDSWHTYTPALSGAVTISLCVPGCDENTAPFDTTLAVFDACDGNQLSGACNDDFDCNGDGGQIINDCDRRSQLTLAMTAGTTYWIRVSGYDGDTGVYSLSVNGGGGTCDHPRDSKWFTQSPSYYSIIDDQRSYLPHADAWAKMHLGFVKPLIVTEDGTYTLHDAETVRSVAQQNSQPEALVIYDERRPEPYKDYFILENREVRSFDGTFTIDEGLAIWLIREQLFPGDGGLVPRRAVRLIRPQYWAANSAALWDGADPSYYDFTSASTPRSTEWTDGSASYVDIYDISAAGPAITLKIRLPGVFVDATATQDEDGTPDYPFNTVAEGVAVIEASGRRQSIRIAGGSYPTDVLIIDTPCSLVPWGSGPAIIGR